MTAVHCANCQGRARFFFWQTVTLCIRIFLDFNIFITAIHIMSQTMVSTRTSRHPELKNRLIILSTTRQALWELPLPMFSSNFSQGRLQRDPSQREGCQTKDVWQKWIPERFPMAPPQMALCTGIHFTNIYEPIIQILRKIYLAPISILSVQSGHSFAHVLSGHVQNCDLISASLVK